LCTIFFRDKNFCFHKFFADTSVFYCLISLSETFIITDYTKANTFRIGSQKEWKTFKDRVYISYDLFGQRDDINKFRIKKNRVEINYQLYTSGLSSKEPFIEYCYSSDQSAKLTWKVLSSGIVKKLPLNLILDIGYGYKWGQIKENEKYNYDVVTLNLNNERKISKFTIKQNLKNIIPRNIVNEKQPIYDYRSSLSTPISKK